MLSLPHFFKSWFQESRRQLHLGSLLPETCWHVRSLLFEPRQADSCGSSCVSLTFVLPSVDRKVGKEQDNIQKRAATNSTRYSK